MIDNHNSSISEAYEQSISGDVNHASHADGVREGTLAFGVIVVAGFVAGTYFDTLGASWYWFVVIATAVGAGLVSFRLVGGAAARRRAKVNAQYRADQAASKEKWIEEAKATGAFDRFNGSTDHD